MDEGNEGLKDQGQRERRRPENPWLKNDISTDI